MHHALDYYIFAHATVLALDKYIVALASDHWLGQDIAPLPTPTIDKKKIFQLLMLLCIKMMLI